MSGKASLEISALLESSVKNVSEIIEFSRKNTEQASENNLLKINSGQQALSESESIFNKINLSTSKMAEMINEISNASKEQSSGISQISSAVTQLDSSTSNMSTNANLAADASEVIASQINDLKKLSQALEQIIK